MTDKENKSQLSSLFKGIYNVAPRMFLYAAVAVGVGVGLSELSTQNDMTQLDSERSTFFILTPLLIGLISGYVHGLYLTSSDNNN